MVGDVHNWRDLYRGRAAKRNVRHRYQRGVVIYRVHNLIGSDRYPIIRVHNLDLCANLLLCGPDVLHGGKVERGGDNLVLFTALKIKAGSNSRKRDRSIGLNLDRTSLAAQDR